MSCIDFIQKLFVSDAQSNENDGLAVAIHGDLAIVSAGKRDVGANSDQGVAYIFHKSDTTWLKEATLIASDGGAFDNFGSSSSLDIFFRKEVDIFGNMAIVGAMGHDSDTQTNIGAAYIFARSDNGTWTQMQALFAPDGASNSKFGGSVTINDQFAVVTAGGNGSAYIFQKSDVVWNFSQKLSDTVNLGEYQVAIDDSTIILGAATDASNRGSAYIFTYNGAQWVQQAKLIPSDGAPGDEFGISVDIFCDYAVIGASQKNSGQGAAYVFMRSDTTWTQQQKLTSDSGRFGRSVSIDGRFVSVGAPSKDTSKGQAYLFKRTGTTWSQIDSFQSSDPSNYDQFGFSLALSYPYLLAGTPFDDTALSNQGSAYIYQITCPNGIALSDLNAAPICPNSFFNVFFDLAGDAAHVTLSLDGSDYVSDFNAGPNAFYVQAPAILSDYVGTITAIDLYNRCCSDVQQLIITVQSSPIVDAGSDRTIPLGSSTEIGVGPALSDVLYTWSPTNGISDVNAFPTIATPTSDTTYTVIAQRTNVSDCTVSDTVTINVCALYLSDVQFHAFSSSIFSVTGYQFNDEPGTRFVSASYLNASDQTQSFGADGFFQFAFIGTPISDGAPVTVTAHRSDCASDAWMVISNHLPLAQGVLGAHYAGSLLEFTLALPPELSVTLPVTSDIHEIYSDICAFADTQFCGRFLAGLTIENQSDIFCSDAFITKQSEIVFVYYSDNVIHMDDADGDFVFSITDFMSDTVTITYSDSDCGLTNDVMNLISGGFSLQTSDEHFLWVEPCFSDSLNVSTNLFSHPLLVIDANGHITDIELIECTPLCHTPTSDPAQICFFKASATKLGNYLQENFPSDYPDNIDHACHVLYTGSLTAKVVTIDLENCALIFSNFTVPCSGSDIC